MFAKVLIPFFLVLFAAASATGAVITTYDSRISFDAALSSSTLVNFNSFVQTGSITDYSTAAGMDVAGLAKLIGINNGDYFLQVAQMSSGELNWGTGALLRIPYYAPGASYLQINFSAPVNAFAADLMTIYPKGGGLVVKFAPETGAANVEVTTSPTLGIKTFVGFSSDTPFTSLQIASLSQVLNGPQGLVDNLEFGNTAETPEVAALLMMAAGLLFLGLGKKQLRTLSL